MTSKADKLRRLRIRQQQSKPGPKPRDGERYPSGDLKPHATERMVMSVALAQRAKYGYEDDKDLRDPKLGSTLGRMCLAGKITETEYQGGLHFLEVTESYYKAIGCPSPHARAQDATRTQGKSYDGDISESRQEQIARSVNRWMKMQTKIMSQPEGGMLKSTLYNLCVMDVEGLFLMPAKQLTMVKGGLIALALLKGLQEVK